MTGGMLPKPESPTLAERAELSHSGRGQSAPPQQRAGESSRAEGAVPAAASTPDRACGGGRHCWVSGLPGQPGRWPGLLLAWARQGSGWSGRVAYAVVDDGHVVLAETWVPAEHLQPAAD